MVSFSFNTFEKKRQTRCSSDESSPPTSTSSTSFSGTPLSTSSLSLSEFRATRRRFALFLGLGSSSEDSVSSLEFSLSFPLLFLCRCALCFFVACFFPAFLDLCLGLVAWSLGAIPFLMFRVCRGIALVVLYIFYNEFQALIDVDTGLQLYFLEM